MSTELRGNLYVLSYAVGFVFLLLITVLRRKAYKTSLKRAVVYSFITFVSGFCGAVIIGVVYTLLAMLKKIAASNFVDVLGAVVFTSLFLLAAIYFEKKLLNRRALKAAAEAKAFQPWHISFRDTMDLMIPGAFIVFACIKIGCAFRGCCFGVECSWGVTAQFYYGKTVFPVQIFESASLFLCALAGHLIQKASFYRRGLSGPFAAFLYGIARFFWEFYRYNPPEMRHFFLGLTIWQLFCILIWIVAGAWMIILFKTQPAEPQPKQQKKNKKRTKQKAKQKQKQQPIRHKNSRKKRKK